MLKEICGSFEVQRGEMENAEKLQSLTKYMRLTIVSMSNSSLQEKFIPCFSRVSC